VVLPMGASMTIFRPEKPSSYAEVLAYHLPWFLLAAAILIASFLISAENVPFRICMFYNVTGYPCISCGFTRGFTGISHGKWMEVLLDCPLAVLMYGLTVLLFVWNGAALVVRRLIARGWIFSGWRLTVWLVLLFLLAAANWIYRIAHGLN
jgi:hypothetical protein